MSRPKIEAIYPLTSMQQALLFHSLQESKDQGFLQVQCALKGNLDLSLFKQAWEQTTQRQPIMRTSIHWEKIEKPVQVVHPQVALNWVIHDWRVNSEKEQIGKWNALKIKDEQEGFNFSKPPISRINIFQIKNDKYYLLWSCHHILLDGWSSGIILKDVFSFYDAACNNRSVQLENLPSYKNYLGWLKNQDSTKVESFWKTYLEGFESPGQISAPAKDNGRSLTDFKKHSFSLPTEVSRQITALARQQHITLNISIQGLWAILLSRYFNKKDVAFGNTVSGRSPEFPNIELMAGMFTNMLPLRVKINDDASINDWLTDLQKQQVGTRNYEQATLDQISEWTNWPGHIPLFESLLVFENFPWSELKGGDVEMHDFKGGLTTTYPLTIIVQPGEQLAFIFKYNAQLITEDTVQWFAEQLVFLLSANIHASSNIHELINEISPPPVVQKLEVNKNDLPEQLPKNKNYIPPQNATELQLTKIWEQVFGLHPISILDNFFEIGGTSLLAVRLLAEIEKQLGKNLPPVTLLQNNTIQSLASVLAKNVTQTAWSSLVPLKVSGSKPPVFCIHAGGGHIFFYNTLARHVGPDQPVYALQPIGLDGINEYHQSIEEMAAHYIDEIRSVQPNGPIALLGTCLSTAVCHEMTIQLQRAGEQISLLAMVDGAPEHFEPDLSSTTKGRAKAFVSRFKEAPVGAIFHLLGNRKEELKKKLELSKKSKQEQTLEKMQRHLFLLYERYDWKPHDGKVTLIRCSEFANSPEKAWLVTSWSGLANGGLEVVDVPGHHLTLFEEPEVLGLAKQLEQCMENASCRLPD